MFRSTLRMMMGRPRVLAWTDLAHGHLLRDALDDGRFELVGIGSSISNDARALERDFEAVRFDDLRQAILSDAFDVLWIIEPVQVMVEEQRAIRERLAGSASGTRIVTCEPSPGLVSEMQRARQEAWVGSFIPLFRASAGWRAAASLLEEAGAARSVHVDFRCDEHDGTLFARLFDAMSVIWGLTGDIDTVSARYIGPCLPVGRRVEAPDILPSMSGTLAFVAESGDQCIASGSVSNQAATWSRRVTIIFDEGALHVTDRDYEWSVAGCNAAEHTRVCEPMSPGRQMGECILRLIAGLEIAAEPEEFVAILGMCEAARLSARTGQRESPQRILEMLSGF